VPFSDTQATFSDPTMPELYSTDGGNIYFVSRNLTLDNTMDADSGTYTCVASNGNAVTPSVTQNFEVVVNSKLDLCNNDDVLYAIYTCVSNIRKGYRKLQPVVEPIDNTSSMIVTALKQSELLTPSI